MRKIITLLAFILIGFSQNQLKAQSNFTAKGKVFLGNKVVHDVVLHVYQGNDLLEVHHLPKSGRFNVELELGELYSLKYVHPDAITKTIQVDTHTPKNKRNNQVSFDIELIKGNNDHKYVDRFDLEFPMVILMYSKSARAFRFNEAYMDEMQVNESLFVKLYKKTTASQFFVFFKRKNKKEKKNIKV